MEKTLTREPAAQSLPPSVARGPRWAHELPHPPPIPALLVLGAAGCAATSHDGAAGTDTSDLAWNCAPRVELSSLWDALRSRYDQDGDGRIPRADYLRGDVRFADFDRTEDGVLTAEDFPTDTHFNGFSYFMLGRADADEDGRVTREEWWAMTSDWDENGDERIERHEVEETLGTWADDWRLFLLSFDQDSDGDFDRDDVRITFVDQDFDGDGVLTGKELRACARIA